MLARGQYSEDPATDHLDTGFSWLPLVLKQILRWFPTLPVATTCFSCSPPDVNLVSKQCHVLYVLYDTCFQVTTELQLIIIIVYYQKNKKDATLEVKV
jgi:uncharacterized membrane protein